MTGPQIPPPSRPLNTNALLSFLLAVLVFPPLGIFLGRKAKKEIAVSGEAGIELATVGEIYGWVMTALMVVGFGLWCAFGFIGNA